MSPRKEMSNPVGSLRVSQEVIATIASYAVAEIDGAHSLAPTKAVKGGLGNLFSRTGLLKAVSINLNDDVAVIDMGIRVKAGAKIPRVCEELQNAVKQSVQSMTGITVSRVNINVTGIVFDEPASVEAAQ